MFWVSIHINNSLSSLSYTKATRLQYLNSHIILDNRCVLQQQHVDCKIADALLKKGTKQYTDGWE